MRITPDNFSDGQNIIEFSHNGIFWVISYRERLCYGNTQEFLEAQVIAGPAEKIRAKPQMVRRNPDATVFIKFK